MREKLKVLDLFSGWGGFSLGLERTGGFETVAFCEIEKYPQRVLAKNWPGIKIYNDVKKLKGEDVGSVDVICGGYPCQGESTAGKRRGPEDDRWLWPEFGRLVDELRPTWVIGENVAGHVSMGLDTVLSDLEAKGYACRPFIIPACAVDAKHRRDRVWVVAHSEKRNIRDERKDKRAASGKINTPNHSSRSCGRADKHKDGATMANTNSVMPSEPGRTRPRWAKFSDRSFPKTRQQSPNYWPVEPGVGRVANGIPHRVERLKGCGNSVVPQIPEMIGYAILEAERCELISKTP